jgi:hypothetical protein
MWTFPTDLDDSAASSSLAALAEQLRDGPLQELTVLQREATKLALRAGYGPGERLEDLERLVRLSLSAMEHFHAFTREFQAVIRELRDASVDPH